MEETCDYQGGHQEMVHGWQEASAFTSIMKSNNTLETFEINPMQCAGL
ncbi:6183_t:CDS:2, partial [Acaulospora colombiana]